MTVAAQWIMGEYSLSYNTILIKEYKKMPFTVSHAVAVLPLAKYLGKFGALSALIVGSMMPDFAYITPFLVYGDIEAHSIIGIFVYSLPAGLVLYYLYHLLMAPVWTSLLPRKLQGFLSPHLLLGKIPPIPFYILIFSLIIGAFTHVFWDFFTHAYGIPRYVEWFNQPLTQIDGYNIMPFRVLQHFSSIFGLSLLMFLSWAWYQRKKRTPNGAPNNRNSWQASKTLKLFSFISLFFFSALTGTIIGYLNMPETEVMYGVYRLQVFVRYGIVGAAAGFITVSILLGLVYRYHLYRYSHTS